MLQRTLEQLQRSRLYTYADSRGNTTGVGIPGSGFQVLDDMHSEA
jgi:hypothetical protein